MTTRTLGVRPQLSEHQYPGRGRVGAVAGGEDGSDTGDAQQGEQQQLEEEFVEYLKSLNEEEAMDSGFEEDWRKPHEAGVFDDVADQGGVDGEVEAGPNPILRNSPVKPDQE